MLQLRGVQVRYGSVEAVRSVDLDVNAGEIIGVIGPNGAGKSSLLNTIVGVVPPTAGEISFRGRSLVGLQPEEIARSGISIVPEGHRIFSTLTVEENLEVALAATTMDDRAGKQARLRELLTRYPILADRIEQMAGGLSGGERQQLAIARALVSEPKLLLLDEPSLGLAPKIVESLFEDLDRLREDGVTVVLVEQQVAATLAVADRTYVLRNGRITFTTLRTEPLDEQALRSAYFGFETSAREVGA